LAKNRFVSRLLFDSGIWEALSAFFSFYTPVFCLRALIHEFERRSLKIIHEAVLISITGDSEKSDPGLLFQK